MANTKDLLDSLVSLCKLGGPSVVAAERLIQGTIERANALIVQHTKEKKERENLQLAIRKWVDKNAPAWKTLPIAFSQTGALQESDEPLKCVCSPLGRNECTEYETSYEFSLSIEGVDHGNHGNTKVLDFQCALSQEFDKATDQGVFFTIPEFDIEQLEICTSYFRKERRLGTTELLQLLRDFLTDFCSQDIVGFLSMDFEQIGCCGASRDASPPRLI